MANDISVSSAKPEGKGFHPLYLWALCYVALTYAYPVIAYAVPHVDASVTSDAAYGEATKAQNGIIGSNLPLFVLLIPVILLILNIVISLNSKKTGRRYLLNAARIIKYLLVPFYVMGALAIVAFFLLTSTQMFLMVFVSQVAIVVLCVLGWISMAGSAPLMIAYLAKSVKDGKNGKLFAIGMGIMQFVFGLDVIGAMACAIKERKH